MPSAGYDGVDYWIWGRVKIMEDVKSAIEEVRALEASKVKLSSKREEELLKATAKELGLKLIVESRYSTLMGVKIDYDGREKWFWTEDTDPYDGTEREEKYPKHFRPLSKINRYYTAAGAMIDYVNNYRDPKGWFPCDIICANILPKHGLVWKIPFPASKG